MIQYQFFPRSQGVIPEIKKVIDCFYEVNSKIEITPTPKRNIVGRLLMF